MTKKQSTPVKKSSVVAKGLIHVHGRDGVGKTTFALTATKDPSGICMLDGDAGKSQDLTTQMGVAKYHNLSAKADDMTEVEYHEMVLALLDSMINNGEHYDVLVYDNAAEFLLGAHPHVATNHPKFRKLWRGDAAIIGGLEWQSTRLTHLPRVYAKMQQIADLVIIVTHEKDQSIGGIKTGLTEPIGDPSLRTAAGVVIRLIKNTREDSPEPVGLVIKNTGTIKDRKPIRYFPERISPCNWEKIEHYFNNPISNSKELKQSEIPNEFEQHLIEGTLNPEQQEMLKWRKNMMELQADEQLGQSVLEIAAQNSDAPDHIRAKIILNSLKDEYDNLTLEKIERILEKSSEGSDEQPKTKTKKTKQ
jgi:hypothetical protein